MTKLTFNPSYANISNQQKRGVDMGVIKYASKWDLAKQTWTEPTKASKPRSFGVATHMSDYDIIKNSKDRGINYIFVCYGTRIEDSSKDSKK